MASWKRNFSWFEHCCFYYDVSKNVIKASIFENPLIYKVLEIVNNIAFVSMEHCGNKFYYVFSLAKEPLMGLISCMPIAAPYLQKKRALDTFEYFKKKNLYHPKYDFGRWWEEK